MASAAGESGHGKGGVEVYPACASDLWKKAISDAQKRSFTHKRARTYAWPMSSSAHGDMRGPGATAA